MGRRSWNYGRGKNQECGERKQLQTIKLWYVGVLRVKCQNLVVIFEVILTGCSPFEIRNLVLRLALGILRFLYSQSYFMLSLVIQVGFSMIGDRSVYSRFVTSVHIRRLAVQYGLFLFLKKECYRGSLLIKRIQYTFKRGKWLKFRRKGQERRVVNLSYRGAKNKYRSLLNCFNYAQCVRT